MGFFDYYCPKPDVSCPVCGASGGDWQGKDGPCESFVWEQGHAAPVSQEFGECNSSPEERAKVRLPVRFEIYRSCRCPTFLEAVGFAEDGVWRRTELLSPTNAVPYKGDSDRQFRKRLDAYAKQPGHAG